MSENLAPFCEREDCRIACLGGTSTLMGWTPEYDKHGKLLNSDPNTRVRAYRCATCGQSWSTKTCGGESEITLDKDRAGA